MKVSRKTIRLSVDVSPEFYKMLDKMAEESHSSKSDILKKSVVLLNVILDEGKKDHQVGILGKDDKLITKIVGI